MNRYSNPIRSGNAAQRRRDLYARLGLTDQASKQDVEAAHKELLEYLERAPDSLSKWAQAETAAVDEAHARITEPATSTQTGLDPRLKKLAVAAGALAVAIAVTVGVYKMGDSPSAPAPKDSVEALTQNLTPAERSRVDQLMKQVDANPKDAASFIKLGDIFFKIGDYNAAGGWMEQAVAAEPKNVKALLALGAAKFNLGDATDAKRQWLRVIALDPKNVEAYYDLGFLYLSKKPPDMVSVKKAWNKVVELDPSSDVAKTVKTHLKQLKNSPTASASDTSSDNPQSAGAPPVASGE